MKNNKWEVAQGASNLGEDDVKVAVYKVESTGADNGITKVAYCAYSGLKILEIKGVSEVLIDDVYNGEDAEKFEDIVEEKDWEVGFVAKLNGDTDDYIVTIDDCENFVIQAVDKSFAVSKPVELKVLSSEEYMADEYDELDIELLKIFCYL